MTVLAVNGGKPEIAQAIRWTDWPVFEQRDRDMLQKVLEGKKWCRIYPDSWAENFERKFATFHDSSFAIATSNGTVSLQLALRAAGVRAGDEVIVPAVTFIATASAVSEIGAVPVFADIVPETAQIDPSSVEANITPRTKAVMGVHYGGYPFDFDALLPICRKHGIPLIEDAAHAHATEWKGKKVGAIGDIGSFSFQESKSLSSGEGGAVTTNSPELFENAMLIHNIGRALGKPDYMHSVLSSNYRMSEFHAALLIAQMEKLPEQTKTKEENAVFLRKALGELGLIPLKTDQRITNRGYYFLVFRYRKELFGGADRDVFLNALQAEGVPAKKAYGAVLYKNEAFKKRNLAKVYSDDVLKHLPDYENTHLPNSEKFCEEEQITILHYYLLSDRDKLQKIVDAVEKILKNSDELA